MTPPAVGLGTLSRLAAICAGEAPVLSVYLGFDQARSTACLGQFETLVSALGHPPRAADRERIGRALEAPLTLAYGTRSVALFATAEGSRHAMVPLPAAVEPMAVLEPIPWLEPVAGMLTSGNWGAAVIGRRAMRLMRGGESGLVEFAVAPAAPRPAARRCASAAGARQAAEDLAVERVRQLTQMLARAHRRRPFDRLVLSASRQLWSPIERALAPELRARLGGFLDSDPSLSEPALRDRLVEVLGRSPDGRGQRCGRCTSTAAADRAPGVVSQTTARLAHTLPRAECAEPPRRLTSQPGLDEAARAASSGRDARGS